MPLIGGYIACSGGQLPGSKASLISVGKWQISKKFHYQLPNNDLAVFNVSFETWMRNTIASSSAELSSVPQRPNNALDWLERGRMDTT